MKKLFFLSIMLTAALAANAQKALKIAPKMEKGTEKTYHQAATTSITGQADVTTTSITKYTVTEVTADGYVIEVVTTEVKTDAAPDNLMGQVMAVAEEMTKDMVIKLATDKDGKPVHILNYQETAASAEKMADQLIDKLFTDIPALSQTFTKDAFKQQVISNLTEENMLKTMQQGSSVLTLNGKTVMTGSQDEYPNALGMKMKRMFFVNGSNVTTNSSVNMTKEDMKAMIISEVEKGSPEQAEAVKQNIDKLLDSGLLKMDMKETATYEYQADGWIKAIKSETITDVVGQQSKVNVVVTLVN